MTFTGPIEDRIAIRELIESYSDAVFRRDAEAWGALWAKDGVWTLMGQEVRGRDTIVGAWKQAMSAFEIAAFFAQPGALSVEGSRARGRCWTHETLRTTDGGTRRIVGAYEDTFVKDAGVWLFASRSYAILIDQNS